MDGIEHGFELPKPQPENNLAGSDLAKKQEQLLANPELPSTGGLSNTSAAKQDDSGPVKTVIALDPPVENQQVDSPGSNSPAIADDNDLIEKEWVDKAKQIVEKTKDDPHKQNREINKFKADYMKKRYGKELMTEG